MSSAESSAVPPLKRSRFSIDVEDIDGGSPAEDSVLLDVTKPRGSPSLQCDPRLLPPGPRNYAELFNWPRHVIRRLVAEDGPCRIPEDSKAERLFRVHLTTAFSGIGAPEIAANFVQRAMFQHGMPIDINVHCQTELDETCQGLLGAPCRFHDVCGRAHVAPVSKLEKMQAKCRNLLEAAKEKQPSKNPRSWCSAIRTCSYAQPCGYLRKTTTSSSSAMSASCVRASLSAAGCQMRLLRTSFGWKWRAILVFHGPNVESYFTSWSQQLCQQSCGHSA